MSITQYYAAESLFLNGLQLSWTSNTSLTVQAGHCRDSTNNVNMNLGGFSTATPKATLINASVNGVNGLDTGTLGSNLFYAVYVIGDQTKKNPPATMVSLSATQPYMPIGYNVWRRIGWALTNGSSQFLIFYQDGTQINRYYQWDIPISVLNAPGIGTSPTAFTSVAINAGIPQICRTYFVGSATVTTANNLFQARPTGSNRNTLPELITINIPIVTSIQYFSCDILPGLASGLPSIDYKMLSVNDTATLYVKGFDDSL